METKNPVGWFEIYIDDIQRAKKFYETVLRVALTELPNPTPEEPMQMFAFPMDPTGKGENASGALVKMEGFKAGGNSTIVYFVCDDCAVEERRVEEAGGKVIKSKLSIGEFGFMALCSDTEGNMIGLHSMK